MFRAVLYAAAALFTFGIATVSAAADDRLICGDWHSEESVAACSRLISQNPNVAAYYYYRGNAYRAKRDNDRAIADYGQAIWLDPKDAEAYFNRGNAYNGKGDYDRAIADFDEAIRLDPKIRHRL
jgi:tetratricopeptide (TPR) repeat protein